MHVALVGVRDGFISSTRIQPEPEMRVLDSDTSVEITHLARKPIPYTFSRTLQVFKRCRVLFMAHFMTRIPKYVYLGIGVILGNVIKSAINHWVVGSTSPWGVYNYGSISYVWGY